MQWVRLALSLILCGLQCRFVAAWSPAGHDRITRIAEHFLTGKKKDQVRAFMHCDLPDTADHEANMTKLYPRTASFHWHQQDPDWQCNTRGGIGEDGTIQCDGHGAEGGSLFCALAWFFQHFSHDALVKQFPQPKVHINTPAKLPLLDHVPQAEHTPQHFLKWMVTLMGDMHQPLHWLPEHEYGSLIEVIYKNETYTLLFFWETYLPNHLLHKLETGVAPFLIDKNFSEHSALWGKRLPTEMFREWAMEVAERVCTEVYAPMKRNSAHLKTEPFRVTEELFETWAKLAENLMELAGERLAWLLIQLLEHKRRKDGVSNLEQEDIEKAKKEGRSLDPGGYNTAEDFDAPKLNKAVAEDEFAEMVSEVRPQKPQADAREEVLLEKLRQNGVVPDSQTDDRELKPADDRELKPADARELKPADDRELKPADDRDLKPVDDRDLKPVDDRTLNAADDRDLKPPGGPSEDQKSSKSADEGETKAADDSKPADDREISAIDDRDLRPAAEKSSGDDASGSTDTFSSDAKASQDYSSRGNAESSMDVIEKTIASQEGEASLILDDVYKEVESSTYYLGDGTTNLLIAIVWIPSLLFALNWHARSGSNHIFRHGVHRD